MGIDPCMSAARALTNLVGNGVATLVVAKWTGDLDMARPDMALSNPNDIESQEPEVLLDLQVTHMAVTKSAA